MTNVWKARSGHWTPVHSVRLPYHQHSEELFAHQKTGKYAIAGNASCSGWEFILMYLLVTRTNIGYRITPATVRLSKSRESMVAPLYSRQSLMMELLQVSIQDSVSMVLDSCMYYSWCVSWSIPEIIGRPQQFPRSVLPCLRNRQSCHKTCLTCLTPQCLWRLRRRWSDAQVSGSACWTSQGIECCHREHSEYSQALWIIRTLTRISRRKICSR